MATDLNVTAPVRAGEELPLLTLEEYLRQRLPDARGPISVEQFSHGHSNLTYLVRLGASEMVLRRPPVGNRIKTAHDMGREFRVLSRLHPHYAPAPRPYFFCEDAAIVGEPFYCMERRRGVILRKQLPDGLVIQPEMARNLSESLIDNLAALHALDIQALGLGDLGKPMGYNLRQVSGWNNRYQQAMTERVPSMDHLAMWLLDNVPTESHSAILHNDYKYDNLVLDPEDLTRIVAVLDWEMATVGDPLMDLGTTLGYWVQANDPDELQATAVGPTSLPGNLSRAELIERYQWKSGRPVTNPFFYYAFGVFKIAVILQQIYARYALGLTRDPRFAQLDRIVLIMSRHAHDALRRGCL